MKFCPNCNIELSEAVKFCPNCGTAISEPEANEAEGEVEAAANTAAAMPEAGTAPPPGAAAIPVKIENHLIKAIIATACCCIPFGIVAIIFAAKVDTKLAAGDVNGALESSKKASMWGNLAIGVGVLMALIYVVAMVVFTITDLAGGDILPLPAYEA